MTFDEASVQNLVEIIRVVEKEGLFSGHKATLVTCGVVIVLGVLVGLALMAVSYLVGR